MYDITSILTDKDDKTAYENIKRMAAESENSDKYYSCLSDFADLLNNEKSYVRTRAFIMCCKQARWDTERKLDELLPKMLLLLHDEKPTVVRQCLSALKELAQYRPELNGAIEAELNTMDLSKYKDSMAPLIEKDIAELMKHLTLP